MSLLRIDASIQGPGSASTQLVDGVVEEFLAGRPDVTVVRRHLGRDPLPATAWGHAVTALGVDEADRTPDQSRALALAVELNEELCSADAVVLAAPLYNFGVSQHVKTWLDLVLAATPPGRRLLDGVPVVLVTTRGGAYGPGTPREGWDHSATFMRQTLADMWGADLTVVEREFTLVGVNPALDEFTDLAASMHADALRAARRAGLALGARQAAAHRPVAS